MCYLVNKKRTDLFGLFRLISVFCGMQVHIGKKIKERTRELGIRPVDLAERLNTSKQNMYGIFKRTSVDTDMLIQLSKLLDYDFFACFQKNKPGKLEEPKNSQYEINAGIQFELKQIKKEMQDLKEKFELLKDVVDLMKKRI